MTTNAFPSASNINGGKALTEANMRRSTVLGNFNHATLGLALTLSGGSVIVGAGEAIIGGRRVWIDGSDSPTWAPGDLGANATKFIHLKTVEDGSGNLASVSFTAETSCKWQATSGPNTHYLCLGRVKTNATTITEVVNAIHFPRQGRGYVGRTAITSTATLTAKAGTDYITGLLLPKFMAPRDCLLEINGVMSIQNQSATAALYARLVDDAARTTILGAAVGHNGSDQYVPLPIGFTVNLTAGQVIAPRMLQRSNVAGSLIIPGGYAQMTGFLSDRT